MADNFTKLSKPLKVVDVSRKVKKIVVYKSFETFVKKCKDKFTIPIDEQVRIYRADDGFEVDDEESMSLLLESDTECTFMLVRESDSWNNDTEFVMFNTVTYYNKISGVYDSLSPTVGADIVAGLILVNSRKPQKDIHILEAGCGTGGFAKALLGYGFRRISLLDASPGMLDTAREMLSDEIQKGHIAAIVEATLPSLPFDDDTFDVVNFSWVLHHIERNPDGEQFPGISDTLKEAHRVMRKNGLLTIVIHTPFGMSGIWWTQLIPELFKRYSKQLPSIEQWENMFAECQFQCLNKVNSLGAKQFGPWILDAEGPLNEDWRNRLTYWSKATEDEINAMEKRMKQMKTEGTLKQWMRDNDKMDSTGAYTVFVCMAE